jgi:hypothetical protein
MSDLALKTRVSGPVRPHRPPQPSRLPSPDSVGAARKSAAPRVAAEPESVEKLTDSELTRIVELRLQHALPSLLPTVKVRVDRGVAHLSGSVESSYERMVLLQSVQHVAGVRQVVNGLAICAPEAAAASGRSLWLKGIVAFVLVAGVVTGGAYWWFAPQSTATVAIAPLPLTAEFQGKAAAGAYIRLFSPDAAASAKPIRSGRVAQNGQVEWTGPVSELPAAGEVIVTAVWSRPVYSGQQQLIGPNVLPAEYSSPSSSPLRLTLGGEPLELELSPKRR